LPAAFIVRGISNVVQVIAARPLLDELVKKEPESADLNFELGDVLLNVDDVPNAIHYLETAIKLAPAELQAHASMGRAYTRAGQPLRALPHLRAAAAQDPDGRGYYTLAQAYEAAGQRELGREALRKYREASAARRERETETPEEYQIAPPW
jgi:predicted Zn-dependent protease